MPTPPAGLEKNEADQARSQALSNIPTNQNLSCTAPIHRRQLPTSNIRPDPIPFKTHPNPARRCSWATLPLDPIRAEPRQQKHPPARPSSIPSIPSIRSPTPHSRKANPRLPCNPCAAKQLPLRRKAATLPPLRGEAALLPYPAAKRRVSRIPYPRRSRYATTAEAGTGNRFKCSSSGLK